MSCEMTVKQTYASLIRSIATCNNLGIAACVWNIPEVKENLSKRFCQEIELEAKSMCASNGSSFRLSDMGELRDKIDFSTQEAEMRKKCPTLTNVLYSAGCCDRNVKRNKIKTRENIKPRLMTAAGLIFNARSERMNTHQVLNAMILRRAAAKKSAFIRFNARSLSVAYQIALKKQLEMGSNFDKPVVSWMNSHRIKESDEKATELDTTDKVPNVDGDLTDQMSLMSIDLDEIDDDSFLENSQSLQIEVDKHDGLKLDPMPVAENELLDSGQHTVSYRLVGDNCDLRTKCRTTSRTRTTKDQHLFLTLAVRNRVIGDETSEFGYHKDKEYCPAEYLPSVDDNLKLRDEFKILIGQTLKQHLEEMSWLDKFIPDHITHEYTKETTCKSEIVSMRI